MHRISQKQPSTPGTTAGDNFQVQTTIMSVDMANNLWVGSEYGLRKFVAGNNSTFTLYDTSNSPLPSAYILDVEADLSGGIWIGTAADLVGFDGTNWMIYNQANTGMPFRRV